MSGSRRGGSGGSRRSGGSGRGHRGPKSSSSGRGPRRGGTGGSDGGGRRGLGGRQVEGRQAVRELLIAGRRTVHDIWIAAELEHDDGVADIVEIARAQRVPVSYVGRSKLEREARSEAPQGVLARAGELPEADLGGLLAPRTPPPFLVAVDGVTDPGNLGAIIRSCDGAGVGGVLLPRHRAVHVTPTVAKAAAGAIEYVPLVIVPGLPNALQQLRDERVWTVGLDDGADRPLTEIATLATEAICLVLGAEGSGLSRLVRERCDSIVSIPMLGHVGSLNVSAATALATYEVARARGFER